MDKLLILKGTNYLQFDSNRIYHHLVGLFRDSNNNGWTLQFVIKLQMDYTWTQQLHYGIQSRFYDH